MTILNNKLRSTAFRLLFSALLLFPLYSKAQVQLSITRIEDLPDSLNEGDSAVVKLTLKNSGTGVFNGNLVLNAFLEDTAIQQLVQLDTLAIPNFFLAPNDTAVFAIPIWAHTQNTQPQGPLRIGNNVIVIWPASSIVGVSTLDSLMDSLVITGFSSVQPGNGRIDGNNIYFYFNLEHGELFVLPGPDKVDIEKVEVYDMLGRSVYTHIGHPEVISIGRWQSGIYLIRATFRNGERKTYKVLKRT